MVRLTGWRSRALNPEPVILVDADGAYAAATGGDASAANQDEQTTELQGVNTKLTTLDTRVDTLETLIASTNTKLDTLEISVDAVTSAVAAGAAIPAGTASIGGTKDNGPHWTSVCGVAGVAFSSADAQTAAAVTDAPTGGQKLCIDDVVVSVGATAMAVSLVEETSLALMFPILYMPANSTVQLTLRGKRKLLVADKKLMVDASAAGNISILATYHSEA